MGITVPGEKLIFASSGVQGVQGVQDVGKIMGIYGTWAEDICPDICFRVSKLGNVVLQDNIQERCQATRLQHESVILLLSSDLGNRDISS